nr:hypothetical protein [Tanacetum cinerariifolium]
SSTRTTHIIDKIRKSEELLTSGKSTLVDEADNPLKKVEFLDDYDSEDEVASVDNDMAHSMASEKVPSIDVSNSNPFEVLNSVDNDVELGTNGMTTNLVNNEATSSGSSFMNVNNSSTRTTHIIDKIRKSEELLTSGKSTNNFIFHGLYWVSLYPVKRVL